MLSKMVPLFPLAISVVEQVRLEWERFLYNSIYHANIIIFSSELGHVRA